MGKKNVVSIEERIPTLKQERKKKANRRLIIYLSIFFFLISVIVYLQSSLSHVKTVEVLGNSLVSDQEIIDQSSLSENTNMWMINESEVVHAISQNSAVKSVEVQRQLPWTIVIQLAEYSHVGYIKENGNFLPIMGNGKVLTKVKQETVNGDAPFILGFSDKEYLKKMTEELSKLPKSILNLISELHWKPNDTNKNEILLYMNDGFVVNGTIRNFAEKMKVYPSIVAQLKPENKGVIHIGVGAYFEEFNTNSKESSDEKEIENDIEG